MRMVERSLLEAVQENADIHDRDCLNLNPATNAMNPKGRNAAVGGAWCPALTRLSG